jgi:hypothetical protein
VRQVRTVNESFIIDGFSQLVGKGDSLREQRKRNGVANHNPIATHVNEEDKTSTLIRGTDSNYTTSSMDFRHEWRRLLKYQNGKFRSDTYEAIKGAKRERHEMDRL